VDSQRAGAPEAVHVVRGVERERDCALCYRRDAGASDRVEQLPALRAAAEKHVLRDVERGSGFAAYGSAARAVRAGIAARLLPKHLAAAGRGKKQQQDGDACSARHGSVLRSDGALQYSTLSISSTPSVGDVAMPSVSNWMPISRTSTKS